MANDRPKDLEPVAKLKEESEGKKFVNRFFNTDVKQIRNNFIEEMVVPGLYNAGLFLYDQFWAKGGKKMNSFVRSSLDSSKNNKTNYTKYSYKSTNSSSSSSAREDTDYTEIAKPKYNEIVVETREDAIRILDSMTNYIRDYGEADRGNLYSFVGIPQALIDFQDSKWGWTKDTWKDYSFAYARGGGYLLKLPPISPLSES